MFPGGLCGCNLLVSVALGLLVCDAPSLHNLPLIIFQYPRENAFQDLLTQDSAP